MIDVNKQIKYYSYSEINTEFLEVAKQLIFDLHIKLTQEETIAFIKRVTWLLCNEYKELRWGDVINVNTRLASGVEVLKKFSVSDYMAMFASFKARQVEKKDDREQSDRDYENASPEEKKRREAAMIAFIYRFNRGLHGDKSTFEDYVQKALRGEIKPEKLKSEPIKLMRF